MSRAVDEHREGQPGPPLRIITFATFSILRYSNRDWQELTDKNLSSRGPSRTLLKVLVCCVSAMDSYQRPTPLTGQHWQRHEASRDYVIDALWPNEDEAPSDPEGAIATAKSVLNSALQQAAGADVVLLTDGTDKIGYRLNSAVVSIDADTFETMVQQASAAEGRGEQDEALRLWEAAYDSVQGEFLPHDLYNEWSTRRRERLHSTYRLCLHRLVRLYKERSRISEALCRLHPYALAHPSDLDALSLLVPLLGQQGRYEEAVLLCQTCRQAFQEESIEPPAALTTLEKRLRQAQEEAVTHLSRAGLAASFESNHVPHEHARAVEQAGILGQELPSPAASSLPAESGVQVPAYLVVDASLCAELPDGPMWCAEQTADFKALIANWQGQGVSCLHLQALLHTELERWNIAQQPDGKTDDVFPTRRTVLTALAALSPTLLVKMQAGPLTALLVEELLAQSATGLTACWHLVNADGLAAVEYALPKYLPLLVALARQPSSYQQTAAYLAAQGSLLMYLISYHRLRFREELAYARQAVELADTSGNRNLHVYALVWLGGAFERNGQPKMMLQKYQEAAQYVNEVVPLLRSSMLAELAYAYARNGQTQDALRCIGQARNLFPSELGKVPCFISSDYGLCELILYEGLTHLVLGEVDAEHVQQHSQQASNAFAQFAHLPSTIIVPERYRIQIINEQAKAAIGVGKREEFEHYLLAGIEGAKALGSEKRRQEAIANWRAARRRWPHEEKILKLADVLMEP